MRKLVTRSIEECEKIARLWLEGSQDKVVRILGGEPTSDFISTFKPEIPVKPAPKIPTKQKVVDTPKSS